MKIADMPAAPVLNGDNEPADFDHSFYRNGNLATGLTKRETMFMHVMGHVLAAHLNPMWEQMGYRYQDNEEIVRRAVEIVDLGLAELGRTK